MHHILLIIAGVWWGMSVLSAQGDIEKLPPPVNTDLYDETTPVISGDGQRMFFTRTADPDFNPTIVEPDGRLTSDKSDHLYVSRLAGIYSQLAGEEVHDPLSSVYNQDIWFVELHQDTPGLVVHPGYPLNNALPNSLVSTGMAPDEYVVLNQFYEDGSMFSGFSRVRLDTNHILPLPSPMHIYEFHLSGRDVHLTMTSEGHVLILSMDRSDGLGEQDLFVSFYVRHNVWSAPIHMGAILNTQYRESTPHISPDKRYLYFSSNRPGGFGGQDIYVSERLDYTWLRWSEPVLLTGPANTSADESQPYFSPDGHYMYFTSRRDGTSDIYRQRLTPRPRLIKPLYIRGTIVNAATGLPVRGELFWGPQSSTGYMEYFNSYNGLFFIEMTEYEPYKFFPRKSNHRGQRILVDPRLMEKQGVDTFELVLYLETRDLEEPTLYPSTQEQEIPDVGLLLSGRTVAFHAIRFARGKDTILPGSGPALEHLYALLDQHQDLRILVEGHTDNVGQEDALIELSWQRAGAVRSYLAGKGIDADRIQIAGVGASRPVSDNSTEKGRERNRRVEITAVPSPK